MGADTVTQQVTDELCRWIVSQADAGCSPGDILRAMRASGWQSAVAQAALEHTLGSALEPAALPRRGLMRRPAPDPDGLRPTADDVVRPRVLLTLERPRLALFGSLLSDDECCQLIELARPRLARSETVQVQTGGSEVNAARTSEGMFFERGEHPLVRRVEARIARVLRWPVENGEGLQVLRYRGGAEYRPHHDYFDPGEPGTPLVLERGGQRVATVVMYLQPPEQGGATVFPEVGLEVAPVRGNAVFFAYDRPHPDTRTLHGGAPVAAGEKWVATKWLREREF